eukprot:COSAG02_NODE_55809_length_288_cov_1.089947_1_plen_82_part_10
MPPSPRHFSRAFHRATHKSGGAGRRLGIISTGRQVVREEGVLALWRSNGVNCLRIIPVYSLKFGMNDTFRNLYKRPDQDIRL